MTKMASITEIIRSRAQCATEPSAERLTGPEEFVPGDEFIPGDEFAPGDEVIPGGWLTLGAALTAEGVSCWSISYVISKWIPNTIFTPGALHSKGRKPVGT